MWTLEPMCKVEKGEQFVWFHEQVEGPRGCRDFTRALGSPAPYLVQGSPKRTENRGFQGDKERKA